MDVFDSSALLALLLAERGADVVAPIVRGAEIAIVNLGEAFTETAETGGNIDATDAIVFAWGVSVRAFQDARALQTARVRPRTANVGLSLGDRACVARGVVSMLPVITADRQMANADIGVDIRLIH